MRLLLTFNLVCFSIIAIAQNTKTNVTPRYVTNSNRFTKQVKPAKSTESTQKHVTKKQKKRNQKNSFNWILDQQIIEAEKRKKTVAKRHKKEARLAEKPQYNDPSYFGHKKKPKKRSLKRRKLCKECLIIH